MKIGGFQKNSLIDFPGTIACILFTQGCNFKCPYCHNSDLVGHNIEQGFHSSLEKGKKNRQANLQDKNLYDEDRIFEFLNSRKSFLDGVVISGGEPTLQEDLIQFCEQIKQMGYQIKLDTNGARPKVLETLISKNLIDYISMDIKTSHDKYNWVAKTGIDISRIMDSVHLILKTALDYEFRSTCCKPFITRETMHGIGEMIQGAKRYFLQNCSRKVKVLDPKFITDDNRFFSDTGMLELKEIVDQYVQVSIIR